MNKGLLNFYESPSVPRDIKFVAVSGYMGQQDHLSKLKSELRDILLSFYCPGIHSSPRPPLLNPTSID